ncbi:MAG: Fis family transcriptional regulator [Methylibium sp. NZG]|nr:MAG: Fis family transcriptional regulator [Methylibium sp. NZG]
MKSFADPAESFAGLDPDAVARLVSCGADLALVVDADGVIRDLAYSATALRDERLDTWIGQALIQTVTRESRTKVEALLRDAGTSAEPRWRQVNHPSPRGADLPLSYCAMRVGDSELSPSLHRSVIFGRDLRAMAALQQSLVDAQQEALQDHWKLRDALSRNRHLFQTASDGVLIADATSLKVLEANPAALTLFGDKAGKLVGNVFPVGLNDAGRKHVQSMLGTVQATGKSEEVHVSLGGVELRVAASMFRQEVGSLLVVRLVRAVADTSPTPLSSAHAVLLKLVQSAPDCMVVTDVDGRIVSANEAFLELVHLTAESQVRGESLGRWLGRTGVELNVLITTLRQRGAIRLFPTSLRDDHGVTTDIETSATLTHEGDTTFLGFTIRDVSRRPSGPARGDKELPRSASQLTELVGRVPMKDIVGETTDLIEQLCIEAALDLTRDNRAAAAEMLGLSRQSLYVKLRRYGLSEPLAESDK